MSMEDYLSLLVDLHKDGQRQGPGGDAETVKMIELAGLSQAEQLTIADIGCGTGATTLLLADRLNADITAVDFLPDFLSVLQQSASARGLSDNITALECSMDALPFEDETFDVLWSEGAIYNMGFERGVNDWRRFLKPGGLLIVSEITWLTEDRPAELQKHWDAEYPEIDTASSKIKVLEKAGYSPTAYFVLPEHCWLENYYRPLQSRYSDFLQRNGNSVDAKVVVEENETEIGLYEMYKDFLSYGIYIARKGHS